MRASTANFPDRRSHPMAMPPRPERPLSKMPGGKRSSTFLGRKDSRVGEF